LTFCGFRNEKWLGGIENSTKWFFRNKKFVKGRWAELSFLGFKNEKWLGGMENSTKRFLEIKNLSRGGGQN